MQVKPKSNSIITHELEGTGRKAVLTFHVRDVVEPLVLKMAEVSDEVYDMFALHGAFQRISDGAAKSRDPATGKPMPPADKHASMRRLVIHYSSGTQDWRVIGERGESSGGLLFRAMVRAYAGKKTPEELRVFLKDVPEKTKKAMLLIEPVKGAADAIQEESAGDISEAEELLAGW